METMSRNYENRLQELQFNMIKSFDIGYSRANTSHYPAKKPKLMIRNDNRPLSYRLSPSESKPWETNSGRYSPITPPPQPNENNPNKPIQYPHKPIQNPYLPISVQPENLTKKPEEDDEDGKLVIIEDEKAPKKSSSTLLAYRKPQHRKPQPVENNSDEEIDVVSISPPKTPNLKSITGCTMSKEKLYGSPQIISRLSKDEITMEEELDLLKYLINNKIRLSEQEFLALRRRQLIYLNEIIVNMDNAKNSNFRNDNMTILKKDRMDVVQNDNFRIKIPEGIAGYSYTEKLNESEYFRRTIEEYNTFMTNPYVRFTNEEYKVENWVASQHIKCTCHRDILQTS